MEFLDLNNVKREERGFTYVDRDPATTHTTVKASTTPLDNRGIQPLG
jgi:hypothetical protein